MVLAVCWLAYLYTSTAVSPYAALRTVVATVLVVTGIVVGCGALVRDRDRGAVIASAFTLGLFSGNLPSGFVAPACIILLVVLEWRLAKVGRSRFRWGIVSRAMGVVATIATIAVSINAVQAGVAGPALRDVWAQGPGSLVRRAAPPAAPSSSLPDVWLILLDGRARSDKLAEIYRGDDSAFQDALEDRGFEISTRSRSNYLQTQLTLTSMFNLTHLETFSDIALLPDPDPRHVTAVRAVINRNVVFDQLRAASYEIVNVSPGWEEVTIRDADRFVDTGQLNEFELYIAQVTVLEDLVSSVAPNFFEEQHRDRIVADFDVTQALAREPHDRPRFVIAHIPAPHAPVVIDSNGDALDGPALQQFFGEKPDIDRIGRETFVDRYVGLVTYLDRQVIETVDAIVAGSAEPPVIIVMSDHGGGLGWDFRDPNGSDLDERTANFFAASTPGHPGLFDDDHTLINTFPHLLNAYLGASIQDLPDDLYSWTGVSTFDIVPIDDAGWR